MAVVQIVGEMTSPPAFAALMISGSSARSSPMSRECRRGCRAATNRGANWGSTFMFTSSFTPAPLPVAQCARWTGHKIHF